jgi:hypothetical protein
MVIGLKVGMRDVISMGTELMGLGLKLACVKSSVW